MLMLMIYKNIFIPRNPGGDQTIIIYSILVNVDIVYTPEACDDLWLTLSEHTEYMVPPPPPNKY